MLMKQKLLLLLGVLWMTLTAAQAAAPASYVSFSVNGTTPHVGFDKFSNAVPDPYNLGVVYKMLDEDKPNLGITGYQVVIGTDREGYEYEDSHYMLVYIGVYDESITVTGGYYDRNEEGLFLLPRDKSVPVRFGRQFYGGTGSLIPMSETLSANQFVWSDGMIDDFVLPNPLGYDEDTNTYKEVKYQKGHSYVIAIKFIEKTHLTIGGEDSGTSWWSYPWPWEPTEYTSWHWTDYFKECLMARFTYAGDEATSSASVIMNVNGERKQYNLLGENQDPINLGTVYTTDVTLSSDHSTMKLPALGFDGFVFESVVPYTYSAAAGAYGGSMTFTTLKKSEADENIVKGFDVDYRDYKTGNFGGYPAVLCASTEGLVKLSEDWAYACDPLDVWVNWLFSGTHPVMAGWANEGFEDGETYTVAFYFTEFTEGLAPAFIHRNGGKYYKFNFTYSKDPVPASIAMPTADDSIATTPWFTLSGHRVNGQPQQKGIYVRKGKKVVKK